MSGISVDVAKLRSFATSINNLIGDLQPSTSSLMPGTNTNLLADTTAQHPDVGQNSGPAIFTDGQDLYNSYSQAREAIIGDQSAPPGSFADFLAQLKILASVAGQIADNYQTSDNETAFNAAEVDAELNAPPSPQ